MYHHRVRPTIGVWLFMLLVAGSLGIAAGAALGANIGWTVFFATAVMPTVLLIKSTVDISVEDGALRVDAASLPLEFIGAVTVLDAAAARRQRGPELDPACHLVLRGWIPTAVRIENTDSADPVPYWYISTDQPQALHDAIEAARAR
jgi:hypothetical protein